MTKYGYTVGGYTETETSGTDVIERYDDNSKVWTYRSPLLSPTKNISSGFSLLYSGYITGGEPVGVEKQTKMFDEISGWTTKNDMSYAKVYHGGFALKGYGYAVNGYYSYKNCQRYDGTNWSDIVDTSNNRYFNCGFASNTYGYTVGNSISLYAITERYDDVNNTWSPIDSTTFGEKLASFYLNNYGYVTNGSTTMKLDEATNSWTSAPNAGWLRTSLTCFELNSYGYMVGGLTTVSPGSDKRFDDQAQSWSVINQINTPRKYLTSFSFDAPIITCPPINCELSIT